MRPVDDLMYEAEIEALEARLASQTERLAQRERVLETVDDKRQHAENERRKVREDRIARDMQEEMKAQVRLIEEYEEEKRQRELTEERATATRRRDEMLAAMSAEARERMIADKAELDALQARLEHATDTLEARREAVEAMLARQQEVEATLQVQRDSLAEEALSSAVLLASEEGLLRRLQFTGPAEALAAKVRLVADLHAAHAARLQAAASRRELFSSLSQPERDHLRALPPPAADAILDEIQELRALKSRARSMIKC
ncbi:hypothetical protein DIPPA_18630 [Diplonema papillatum]|nr:hypothetical protein DIPPA_18630 [Diplonema papillatum]